jgi:S-DNA-T family DNA segregation ATPase FtsK/SpoIIIE
MKESVAEKPRPEAKRDEERRALEAPSVRSASRLAQYKLPPLDLLDEKQGSDTTESEEVVREKAAVLERTLSEFGIEAQVVEIDRGPVITLYELELAAGIKIGKVTGLAGDMARALKATAVRVVAPIPGKSTVGVEVPNQQREIVRMREIIESGVLERKRMAIPLLLGKDSSGAPLVADLTQMPHLLIAGATGSGKSVCINSLIVTMLMTQYPDNLQMIMIDPKMVELAPFQDIPHLMCPVLTEMKRAASVLEWATVKMDERYELLSQTGCRNITAYNKLGERGIRDRLHAEEDALLDDIPIHMPFIVVIIDELADLMMISPKEAEYAITRLAQKSRSVGIHIVMATQRPSVDVITGLIKANLSCRIAFQTSSMVDSRTILDRNGAETLLGAGDMLFIPPGTSRLVRAQGTYTSDREIRSITDLWRAQGRPEYQTDLVQKKPLTDRRPEERDDLYDDAVRVVVMTQRGSVSLLQRKLGIGYSRAARLIDIMAEQGLVGGYKGSQAREVLLTLEEWEAGRREQGPSEEPAEGEDEGQDSE